MSLVFKHYSLVEVIYQLIRFDKLSPSCETKNTHRNGVNEQNTHTHTHTHARTHARTHTHTQTHRKIILERVSFSW